MKLTTDTYGHLQVEDLRSAVNALPKLERETVEGEIVDAEYSSAEDPAGENSDPKGPQRVHELPDPKKKAGVVGISSATPATSDVGETGFELVWELNHKPAKALVLGSIRQLLRVVRV